MQIRLLSFGASGDRSDDRRSNPTAHVEWIPAFLDKRTGRVEIARTRVGLPATTHTIDWLPREWARTITDNGRISSLKPGIIPGYIRDGLFYTNDELDDR